MLWNARLACGFVIPQLLGRREQGVQLNDLVELAHWRGWQLVAAEGVGAGVIRPAADRSRSGFARCQKP